MRRPFEDIDGVRDMCTEKGGTEPGRDLCGRGHKEDGEIRG